MADQPTPAAQPAVTEAKEQPKAPAPKPDPFAEHKKMLYLVGKRIEISNGIGSPVIDELEYVGIDHIVTKHGQSFPFWQVKAAK